MEAPCIRTPLYQRVDLALAQYGQPALAELVPSLRSEGRGWQAITRHIFRVTKGEMEVSEATIRNWFVE